MSKVFATQVATNSDDIRMIFSS